MATGRAKDAVAGAAKGEAAAKGANATISPHTIDAPTRVEAMREKVKAGGHDSPYRLRKQLPQPVFGQIKQGRGFRQFLMRGIEKVRAEWAIICTTHNMLKLAQGRSSVCGKADGPGSKARGRLRPLPPTLGPVISADWVLARQHHRHKVDGLLDGHLNPLEFFEEEQYWIAITSMCGR